MKAVAIGRALALGLTLSIAKVTLGCTGSDGEVTTSDNSTGSSSSSSSSGADSGDLCTDGGPNFPIDASISFPDCAMPSSTTLRGTLDGMPFNETYTPTVTFYMPGSPDTGFEPATMNTQEVFQLDLALEWDSTITPWEHVPGRFYPVTGSLTFPWGAPSREIKAGSQLTFGCDSEVFKFSLLLDGGELTGCARNK